MRKWMIGFMLMVLLMLSGCVDQNPDQEASAQTSADGDIRIVATSMAAVEICEKLGLDLVGVPSSSISEIPEVYADAEVVGTPMQPDMEILASLNPDWVLSPSSLISDLQPKYDEANMNYAFLNLKSVPGMYKSIQELGELFGKEEEAAALVDEFYEFYDEYKKVNEGKESPTVLVLMGLPGSYIVATENSYVGSLVELAGGINAYAGTDDEFLNVNTEDMQSKDADIILRAAHAMPDDVVEMFAEEFETNDIWQHFTAVKEGRVYDLDYDKFGMSATFQYTEALVELQELLYPDTTETESTDTDIEEDDMKAENESSDSAESTEENMADEDSTNETE